MKKKKVMIVIEENGAMNGKGFDVKLEGDIERIGHVNPEELSPAEFWGGTLMNVCGQVLMQAGVVQTQTGIDGKEKEVQPKGVMVMNGPKVQ